MKPSKLFWGLTLIFVGVLWIITSSGLLNAGAVWARFFSLWPLVIVFIGLNLVITDRRLLSFVGLILLLGSFAYVVYSPISISELVTGKVSNNVQSTETNIDPAEKSMEVTVETGAVSLDIHDLSESDSEKSDIFVSGENLGDLQVSRTVVDGVAKIKVSEQNPSANLAIPDGNRSLKILLSRDIPVSLVLNAGAASENLNLSQLAVRSLVVKSGAVSADLKMSEREKAVTVDIQTGASSYNLLIPKNSGYQITANGGLTTVKYPNGSTTLNGNETKKSPNYDSANVKYNINLKSGLTSLTLMTY